MVLSCDIVVHNVLEIAIIVILLVESCQVVIAELSNRLEGMKSSLDGLHDYVSDYKGKVFRSVSQLNKYINKVYRDFHAYIF